MKRRVSVLWRADRLADDDRRALRLLEARVYGAKGEWENELRLLETLRTEFPRSPDRDCIHQSEFRTGKYAESLRSWDRLSRGLPRGSEDWLTAVYFMIASYQKLGKTRDALSLFQTTTSLYRNFPPRS